MYQEYLGMSYEQASREASGLIERRGWFHSMDRLKALCSIMQHHLAKTKAA